MKLHVFFFACMLLLTGCIFQGDKLNFDTVASGESSYTGEDPLLFVAASYEATLAFTQYTGHDEALKEIDYNQYVVACVLLGVNPEVCTIEIKELIRKEDAIILLTVFRKSKVEKSSDCVTSPFHIIRMRRSDIKIAGKVSFLLEDTRGLLHAKVETEIFKE